MNANNSVIANLDKLRSDIGSIDKDVMAEKENLLSSFMVIAGPSRSEAIASLVIAHRHLEDARMRLGKVIQALEGGVSILDHPRVKELIAEIRSDAAKD